MPQATVEATSSLLQAAIARPDVTTAFMQSGMTAHASTPSALAARIHREQAYWQPVLRANGISAE